MCPAQPKKKKTWKSDLARLLPDVASLIFWIRSKVSPPSPPYPHPCDMALPVLLSLVPILQPALQIPSIRPAKARLGVLPLAPRLSSLPLRCPGGSPQIPSLLSCPLITQPFPAPASSPHPGVCAPVRSTHVHDLTGMFHRPISCCGLH